VRYWDSSAVVALLVDELSSGAVRSAHDDDVVMATWWATDVECVSALARLERERRLDPEQLTEALDRLDELATGWLEVQPTQRVRRSAMRLLRVHALRAADALQLAAATTAAEDYAASLPFVTLDDRLALAAQREGFEVIRPS
jgi:predicted nucleic acid-binding protein